MHSKKRQYNYNRLSKTISYRLPNRIWKHRKHSADSIGISVSKFCKYLDLGKAKKYKPYRMSPEEVKGVKSNFKNLTLALGKLSSQVSELETQLHGIGLNINNLIHSYFLDRKNGNQIDYDNLIKSLQKSLIQPKLDKSEQSIEKKMNHLWQLYR